MIFTLMNLHDVGRTLNWKPETGNWKPETGNWKPETGNRKLETGNWKPKILFSTTYLRDQFFCWLFLPYRLEPAKQ
jgi:hypothetical protein